MNQPVETAAKTVVLQKLGQIEKIVNILQMRLDPDLHPFIPPGALADFDKYTDADLVAHLTRIAADLYAEVAP